MSEGKYPGGLPGYYLHAFTAEGSCSILGQRTNIPRAIWCGQKKKKKEGMRRVRLSEKLAETMDVEVLGGLKNQIQIWILEKMKWHWSEKCLKMSHRKGSDEV